MFSFLNNKNLNYFLFFLKSKGFLKYLFFFLISFSFWFLSMMSKYHETSLILPVKYINFPIDKIVLSKPNEEIDIRVKAPGFTILFYNLFHNAKLTLDLNSANVKLNKNGAEYFWFMNVKRKDISELIPPSMELVAINPQQSSIFFSNKESKIVPVKLRSQIILQDEKRFAKPIKIYPDSVKIYADREQLEKIKFIETENFFLTNVSKSNKYNVDVKSIDSVELDINKIEISIEIEDFIEETLVYNLEVKNLMDGYQIKLFPDVVNITLRVSKEKYNVLQTDLLKAVVDMSQFSYENDKLEVEVINLPSFVQLERVYPSSIEFLLIKD